MCWHKWSKWEEYEAKIITYLSPFEFGDLDREPVNHIKFRQKRYCLKCGKVQDELIR